MARKGPDPLISECRALRACNDFEGLGQEILVRIRSLKSPNLLRLAFFGVFPYFLFAKIFSEPQTSEIGRGVTDRGVTALKVLRGLALKALT